MQLTVNNEKYEFPNEEKLNDVLKIFSVKANQGVAVAVNNNVVPKNEWQNFPMKENDSILIIKATQGG